MKHIRSRSQRGQDQAAAEDKNLDAISQSRCTRDDNLNVEEFMRADMQLLNKEEDKLQRELKKMNQQNLA